MYTFHCFDLPRSHKTVYRVLHTIPESNLNSLKEVCYDVSHSLQSNPQHVNSSYKREGERGAEIEGALRDHGM